MDLINSLPVGGGVTITGGSNNNNTSNTTNTGFNFKRIPVTLPGYNHITKGQEDLIHFYYDRISKIFFFKGDTIACNAGTISGTELFFYVPCSELGINPIIQSNIYPDIISSMGQAYYGTGYSVITAAEAVSIHWATYSGPSIAVKIYFKSLSYIAGNKFKFSGSGILHDIKEL